MIPPFIRQIQQSYLFHLIVAAVIAGGGVAFGCFAKDMAFSFACAKGGIIAAGMYLFGILQHSPGSASFKPDGERNVAVEQVVRMQELKIPVKVVAGQDGSR